MSWWVDALICPDAFLVGKKARAIGISYGNLCPPALPYSIKRRFQLCIYFPLADQTFFHGDEEHNTQYSHTSWESLMCCIAVCSPLTSKQSITACLSKQRGISEEVLSSAEHSPQLHLNSMLVRYDEVCIITDSTVFLVLWTLQCVFPSSCT